MTVPEVADHVERGEHRATGAVGLLLDDGLGALGEPGAEVAVGRDDDAQMRSAPASRAASAGQATIGRPQTGCSTLGSEERMRVPSPAAMIRTVGAEESPKAGQS